MRYPKSYTVKEWKRFNKITTDYEIIDGQKYYLTMQEILCRQYDIILTDYKTKKERFFEVIDKVSIKNLNNGITKFNKGINEFSKIIEDPNKKKRKPIKFGISQKDYDSLFKSPKRKENTMNFWNEDKKTRKKRNRRSKPVQRQDYSALFGKRKVRFF